MPLYAHLFLLRTAGCCSPVAGWTIPSPQGPVTMDLTTTPVTITGDPAWTTR